MSSISPYGAWASPIEAAALASAGKRIAQVSIHDGAVYWVEGRPDEGGRSVLMRSAAPGETGDAIGRGAPRALTPAPFNVRTRAHEYGGGAYAVGGSAVYFCHDADQRVYCLDAAGEQPRPLTPDGPFRYADLVVDDARGLLFAVREDAGEEGEPENSLVSIDQQDGTVSVLVSGHDFYASARVSPDGTQLCWLTWDHPRMPWDGTELWIAPLDEVGHVGRARCIAGGPEESVFQPQWSPPGVLHFVSDRSGWWNIYRLDAGGVSCVFEDEADYGLPQWVFAQSTYAFTAEGDLAAVRRVPGRWQLRWLAQGTGRAHELLLDYTEIASVAGGAGSVAFIAASPGEASAVVCMDRPAAGAHAPVEVLARSSSLEVDPDCVSVPEAFSFPTGGGDTAHGFFYAPANAAFEAPDDEKPPLIVMAHGGPTGATGTALNLALQFWTSRGFAVLDVDYRGSTGYGRAYREKLGGRWGVADVEDCVYGARALGEAGRVDGNRLAIRGGSAGGYTVLAALAFHDVFSAGASYYGISDLEALARDTHKFESRYLEKLIGPYPERRDVYVERSPINHVDRLSCPVIFFQGDEDKVVPPNQAQMMVDALDAKGLPVAYLAFEGEQHGFRKAQTITRTLEAELYFYGRIFGFEPAGELPEVTIKNAS